MSPTSIAVVLPRASCSIRMLIWSTAVKMTSNASPSRSDGVRLRRDEQIFELVRDLGYVGKSQHQSRALDAVRFAKRAGNGVGGSRRFLELQQRGAERLEAIARFFDELADEDGRVDRVHDVNRAGSSSRNTSSPRTPAARSNAARFSIFVKMGSDPSSWRDLEDEQGHRGDGAVIPSSPAQGRAAP